MLKLARLSFRQLSIGVFIVIALLLGATSLHALHTLDRFAALSRAAAERAVVLTANASRLDERGIAMQRAARQFMVLDDPAFRDRYADAMRDATRALDVLEQGIPATQSVIARQWRQSAKNALAVLQQPGPAD
ncbi:two-component sensor histidine kinase, partial [Massilia arenosa]